MKPAYCKQISSIENEIKSIQILLKHLLSTHTASAVSLVAISVQSTFAVLCPLANRTTIYCFYLGDWNGSSPDLYLYFSRVVLLKRKQPS